MKKSKDPRSYGVDVCLHSLEDPNTPHCPHGPTLLFERYGQGQMCGQRFYACSACRDRKDCNFYQLYNEKVSEVRLKARQDFNQAHQPPYTHQEYRDRYKLFVNLKPSEKRFCEDCSLLLLPSEMSKHNGHTLLHNITQEQLQKPSHLLTPLENKKTNAQYLFTDKAVEFTLKCLKDLGFKKVVCIGAPRIHEAIVADTNLMLKTGSEKACATNEKENAKEAEKLQSLLLDIDHRYMQFYDLKQFCRFNMFNNYFFDGESSRSIFHKFLCGKDAQKLVLVTDPPFGGLIEVLAHTVEKISRIWKDNQGPIGKDLPVLWFFPYFMEKRITAILPNFTMLDYKVDYDNHVLFQEGNKGRKFGSPVRIFTNVDPCKIELPVEEGYKFCKDCNKYVSFENVHCKKCDACTSKDGRVYRHCDVCKRCVKPSKYHCDTCNVCVLQDHRCGQETNIGCHVCGDLNHKRRDCPKRNEIYTQRKRKRKSELSFDEKAKTSKKCKHVSKKHKKESI